MDPLARPVQDIPPEEFVPPCCPRLDCPSNVSPATHPFRFRRDGFYRRKSAPHRVQKFHCLTCNRGFSQQTFSTTYYLKRPDRLVLCARAMVAGQAFAQMADSHGGHRSSWARLSERLGRHCLLLDQLCRAEIARRRLLAEALVYDDFETFAACQDYPLGIGTLVGKKSHYVYSLAAAPHRRPRHREWERKRRDRRYRTLGAPPRRGYTRAARATVKRLLELLPPGKTLRLATDGHPAYRAFDRVPVIYRRVWPNPPRTRQPRRTAAMRARDRAMFAVDVLHHLLRHGMAAHRRETIAFHRRHALAALRTFVFSAWRNLVRPRAKRHGRPGKNDTPATILGLASRPWTWTEVLARRLFPWRIPLPPDLGDLYRKRLETPMKRNNTRHDLVHAF